MLSNAETVAMMKYFKIILFFLKKPIDLKVTLTFTLCL